MNKKGYVYLLSNKKHGVIYTGITTNLIRRIFEHKNSLNIGFTQKYKTFKLVYFEEFDSYAEAIKREKRLKEWQRQWKIDLIEKDNPDWGDIYLKINQ